MILLEFLLLIIIMFNSFVANRNPLRLVSEVSTQKKQGNQETGEEYIYYQVWYTAVLLIIVLCSALPRTWYASSNSFEVDELGHSEQVAKLNNTWWLKIGFSWLMGDRGYVVNRTTRTRATTINCASPPIQEGATPRLCRITPPETSTYRQRLYRKKKIHQTTLMPDTRHQTPLSWME